MRFSCSGGGHIWLFPIRPPGGHPNLFAMFFRNLISIPITMPNFKNLSPSARFNLYMAYSSPAIACSNWSSLRWRHNGHDSVSNHQPHDCLLNRLYRRRSKKTSKLRVTGLCVGPVSSPHKWPVTRKMFPFDDVIMSKLDRTEFGIGGKASHLAYLRTLKGGLFCS